MAVRETAKRRRALAELLVAEGSVQIAELAAQYHVSRETIRKDLIFLKQSGVGRRSRGGSLILEGIAEPPLSARSVENIAAKTASRRRPCARSRTVRRSCSTPAAR